MQYNHLFIVAGKGWYYPSTDTNLISYYSKHVMLILIRLTRMLSDNFQMTTVHTARVHCFML